MKNNLFSTITVGLCTLLSLGSCSTHKSAIAPTPDMDRELVAAGKNVELLDDKASESVAEAIAATYTPWQKVSYKGKLKMDGLPISLNLKIYMERGESVIMSLSAPLLGEMGRVEIDRDSILLINKHSKTYCQESVSGMLSELGAGISDFQDLLMGRVFVLGSGTLTLGNAPQVDITEGASGTIIVTPKVQPERAQYGFTLFEDGKMLVAIAGNLSETYMATAEYGYSGDDTEINLAIKLKNKSLKLTLDLNSPDFKPTPLEKQTINPKWTRQPFKTWLKFK